MFPIFVWSAFSVIALAAAIKLIVIGLGLTMVWNSALLIAGGLYTVIIIIVYTKAIIEG